MTIAIIYIGLCKKGVCIMIIDQDAYGKQHYCVDMNVIIQIV